MQRKNIIATLDKIINSGSLNEKEKNELIQVKTEIENSTYLSEALNFVAYFLTRMISNDLLQ